MLKIAASSREKIRVIVSAINDQGQATDPTASAVEFAFTADRYTEPGDTDWVAGSWSVYKPNSASTPVYRAMCLVGPGGTIQLSVGRYWIWVRVTDNPEIPVLSSGALQVGEEAPS